MEDEKGITFAIVSSLSRWREGIADGWLRFRRGGLLIPRPHLSHEHEMWKLMEKREAPANVNDEEPDIF